MSDDERRTKRQKRDTSYKAKAFEKFKQLRSGTRNKYETEEVDNVYEVVEEKEYVKRVLDRQDDDWIVDDDGTGYVEDGRDIFDDDLDAESITQATRKNKGVKRKKGVSDHNSKGNLKFMLSNINKKKEATQIGDDEMLSEILNEIDATPSTSTQKEMKAFIPRKQIAHDYLKSFTLNGNPNKRPKVDVPVDIVSNEVPEVIKETEVSHIEANIEGNSQNTINETQEAQVHMEDDFEDQLDMAQIEAIESQVPAVEKSADPPLPELMFDFSNHFIEDQFDETVVDNNDEALANMEIPFEVADDEVFRFFWWDAFEDPEKQKGTIFLFGKTYCKKSKTYQSCTVAIKNMHRQVFLLPRPKLLDDDGNPTEDPVTYKDLYCEFSSLIAEPMQIKYFKARLVQKKYAFDPSVPLESDYLEVQYPATDPKINPEFIQKNPKTFTKIFGINTSNLERFLLDAKIKGPCWLDIHNAVENKNPLSWCKSEYICESLANVKKVNANMPPPPLTVSTINLRHYMNPSTNQNEILMISCITQTRYAIDKKQPVPAFDQHFCVFTGPSKQPLPINIHEILNNYKGTRVQKMDKEKALLNYFIAQFSKIDPDLIVGHDLQSFQIHLLASRLMKHDITSFSKLSRLKRTLKKRLDRELFTGRLVADIKISAKELIKPRSFDLPTLAQQVLKIPESQIVDLEPDEIIKMYSNPQDILKLIKYTMQDTAYILKILYDLNIVPLALQITNIAGNVMSRTLMGGRSERNEFLLLHAFHEKGYVPPDKKIKNKEEAGEGKSRKKPTYSGGLVLEPKVGFYDKMLLLMDFNSLYPSIIQEYNICFTTLPVSDDDENLVLPDSHLPPGILPVEIRKLVDSRKQVKGLMSAPDLSQELRMQYHIRQMALKLTANSMYGCLGFSNSRFYAKNLAALVTQKGREILTNTKTLVERMSLEVVYGDTDSIMINSNLTDYDQVMKIGQKIKYEVNRLYKMVELDIDGIFKYLLLLKKKKYAVVTLTKGKDGKLIEEKEYKGLDIVRRDWSQLACGAGKFILEHILSDQSEDERLNNIQNYLRKLREDLTENRVPLPLFFITKQLTRDPNLYSNKDALPHVQVALRYNKEHGGHLGAGDVISYVICDDGSQKSATQRAYHPEELKMNENLKIDNEYYLAQQIHPVCARICAPIEGIDPYLIAECLGLDGDAFKRPIASNASQEGIGENITNPEVKFRDAAKFSFQCASCRAENIIGGPLNGELPFLVKCSNSECTVRPLDYLYHIKNQLSLTINSYITKYYENKLICEDPACPYQSERLPLNFVGKYPVCAMCRSGVMFREYNEQQLFCQLSYFVYIFDISNVQKKQLYEESVKKGYDQLRMMAQRYLNVSGYSVVDLGELFDFVLGKKESVKMELATLREEEYFSDSD